MLRNPRWLQDVLDEADRVIAESDLFLERLAEMQAKRIHDERFAREAFVLRNAEAKRTKDPLYIPPGKDAPDGFTCVKKDFPRRWVATYWLAARGRGR